MSEGRIQKQILKFSTKGKLDVGCARKRWRQRDMRSERAADGVQEKKEINIRELRERR
jgi:hypothetical protein